MLDCKNILQTPTMQTLYTHYFSYATGRSNVDSFVGNARIFLHLPVEDR